MTVSEQIETIIALSSGQGRAGVAVLRISGPKSNEILRRLTKGRLPSVRQTSLRWLLDSEGERLDQALILRFEGPNSFTGEDLVELHCHGSIAVVEAVIALACQKKECRLAARGEFSQRAFENGRIDLVQAEGIADLIDSTSELQMKQAARFVAGDASETIQAWRKQVLEASAFLAASIDFSDEGDVSEEAHAPARDIIRQLVSDFDKSLETAQTATRIRDGIRIAIIGVPNAGKSTLMNALLSRDAAIVSDIAGTTRDIIETQMILAGVPVILADTAGLRKTDDPIEAEGVRRAEAWAENADIRLFLTRLDEVAETSETYKRRDTDLLIGTQLDRVAGYKPAFKSDILVSAKTGEGMRDLINRLEDLILSLISSEEAPAIVRLRHRENLTSARSALNMALEQLDEFGDVDLAAFELSLARSSLESILGQVDVEDILGEVFSGFCVGK